MSFTHKMVIKFNSLPNDIILDKIIPLLEYSDITKFILSSKEYHNNMINIYNIIMLNDEFIKDYLDKNNIQLIDCINESSFSLKEFFKIYDNIKNNVTIDNTIKFINIENNITSKCIDETFKLYKLLMSYVIYKSKSQFKNFITTHMIKYFKKIYNFRHPKLKDISKKIFFNLIINKDELKWYLSNLNIYYLYENGNLIQYAKRSYAFKNNLDIFDDGIIDNNENNKIFTINLLIKMFKYLNNIELRIYYIYKIFKYTKHILDSDKTFNFINQNFIDVVKIKTKNFIYDIENEYRYIIPYYIRDKLLIITKDLNILCN